MESLSRCGSPPFLNPCQKSTSKTHYFLSNYNPNLISSNSLQTPKSNHQASRNPIPNDFFNSHKLFPFPLVGLTFPLSCFASETNALPTEQVSDKINLESILVSIDNFFTRYPFFVATVTFIWLVAIPLTEEYLQKYKLISAINAFKKLQNDPNSQLLDIRNSKSIAYLGTPNLKFLSKKAVQVEFREGDEEGFVKRVLERIGDPTDTTLCIIDNFDGNSMKVAELLVKNGLKEAYAMRGGIRGTKGWLEIQETLLPPAVHVYPKKRGKKANQVDTNGGITQQTGDTTPNILNQGRLLAYAASFESSHQATKFSQTALFSTMTISVPRHSLHTQIIQISNLHLPQLHQSPSEPSLARKMPPCPTSQMYV